VLKKISTAAARDCSYEKAAQNLNDLAELTVSAKQCQRVAIRIGNERLDEQAERIARYSQASLPALIGVTACVDPLIGVTADVEPLI
jgi:hypothetical protein